MAETTIQDHPTRDYVGDMERQRLDLVGVCSQAHADISSFFKEQSSNGFLAVSQESALAECRKHYAAEIEEARQRCRDAYAASIGAPVDPHLVQRLDAIDVRKWDGLTETAERRQLGQLADKAASRKMSELVLVMRKLDEANAAIERNNADTPTWQLLRSSGVNPSFCVYDCAALGYLQDVEDLAAWGRAVVAAERGAVPARPVKMTSLAQGIRGVTLADSLRGGRVPRPAPMNEANDRLAPEPAEVLPYQPPKITKAMQERAAVYDSSAAWANLTDWQQRVLVDVATRYKDAARGSVSYADKRDAISRQATCWMGFGGSVPYMAVEPALAAIGLEPVLVNGARCWAV